MFHRSRPTRNRPKIATGTYRNHASGSCRRVEFLLGSGSSPSPLVSRATTTKNRTSGGLICLSWFSSLCLPHFLALPSPHNRLLLRDSNGKREKMRKRKKRERRRGKERGLHGFSLSQRSPSLFHSLKVSFCISPILPLDLRLGSVKRKGKGIKKEENRERREEEKKNDEERKTQ
jgi:hypothetical protein